MQIKTDALNRKKKGIKQSTGKTLHLTPRRLDALKVIRDFYYVDTYWTKALMETPWKSLNQTQDELKYLTNENDTEHGSFYLDWCEEQKANWKFHSTPYTYRLAPSGIKALKGEGEITDPIYVIKSELADFPHAKMICEHMQSIVLGARQHDLTVTPPLDILLEHELPIKVHTLFTFSKGVSEYSYKLKPDNLFKLSGEDWESGIAVEAENSITGYPEHVQNLKDPSILRKILAYDYIMRNKLYTQWGLNNLRVVFLVPSIAKAENVLSVIQRASPRYKNAFLVKVQSKFGDRELTPRPHIKHLTGQYDTINGPTTLLP